ncbi:MAG: (Fe-S)-binding protein, partial [Actinobacteria bacterium]|nr:(Fe-S)-binding protein [Actinomycetota bacterium]
ATAAQLELLKLYFTGVAAYDKCCGLSGTGRLKHPKIGTKISEKLFEQIREEPAEIIVSGCPSCRDGVKMQKEILAAKKDEIANFEVSGIFQEIMKTVKS